MKTLKITVNKIDELLNKVNMEQSLTNTAWEWIQTDKVYQEKPDEVREWDAFLSDLSQALWLLRRYVAIGVEPLDVSDLVHRNKVMPPERVDAQPYFRKHFQPHVCPKCRHRVYDPDRFCSKCGQRLR